MKYCYSNLGAIYAKGLFLLSTRSMSNECIRKSGKRGHYTRAEQEC